VAYLHIGDTLRLEDGVVEVEVLVASVERTVLYSQSLSEMFNVHFPSNICLSKNYSRTRETVVKYSSLIKSLIIDHGVNVPN
jgi:hypothetical protein